MTPLRLGLAALLLLTPGLGAQSFVNWESPHVHPLDLSPTGRKLAAVNTSGGRLEVFRTTGPSLVSLGSVPVGIDPVSVRFRSSREAWVANLVSDSVSVVDVKTMRVVATLHTDDEPCDVVFAGSPQRAFVSCSQANTVLVFDPEDLTAEPQRVTIDAEDPRALAVSADGTTVYAAIFESGNGSTILGGGSQVVGAFPPNVVGDPAGPYGGQNPPPNTGGPGGGFTPPINPSNPAPPAVGLIVKKDGAGNWMDDNGGDWTPLVSGAQASASGRVVGWDLPDRDVAVIDADTLAVSYVTRLMNLCMAMAVRPGAGTLSVVGTDGTNEVRFEPVLKGRFLHVNLALATVGGGSSIVDLNPHLDYLSSSTSQALRDESLGDPRGIVWNGAGSQAYVSGMGSNNVVVIDSAGARAGLAPTIEVGEGPTGLAILESKSRLFVLNKFESSISEIDLSTETETSRISFLDPEPTAVKDGREHLYSTHETSGLGQISCASCHVDARMDRLAWDLGDPSGDMKTFNQNCPDNGCQDWHPMKGPLLTQTMQDIIGKEPFHWRGDRDGLEEFNDAFMGLQGDDETLTAGEMQEFEDFLATIHFPPNPFRNLDNTLPTALSLEGHTTPGRFAPAGQPLGVGDATRGLTLYQPPNLLDGVACVTCHTMPTGLGPDGVPGIFGFTPAPPGPNGERHHATVSVDGSTNVTIKIPHLRNLHERVGMDTHVASNRAGTGFLHDGSIPTLADFVAEPLFGVQSDQDIADLVAFMLAFSGSDLPTAPGGLLQPPGPASKDTHAAVGTQVTFDSTRPDPAARALVNTLVDMADAGEVGVVVKGRVRGWTYVANDNYQSDRLGEITTHDELRAMAGFGSELTWTAVPDGTQVRVGIDRDLDGAPDLSEVEAGTDPADAGSVPGACASPLPSAPDGLAATGTQDKVTLTWNDLSSTETGFQIERRLLGNPGWSLVGTTGTDENTFADHAVLCGRGYVYRVTAVNCTGSSAAARATAATLPCLGLGELK